MFIQTSLHFSAEPRLLKGPSDCSSYIRQLDSSSIFLSWRTHLCTNTHSAALLGTTLHQCRALWEKSSLIRAGPWMCSLWRIQPGLQNVLAMFISLLTSLSTPALTWEKDVRLGCLSSFACKLIGLCSLSTCSPSLFLLSRLTMWDKCRGLIMSC